MKYVAMIVNETDVIGGYKFDGNLLMSIFSLRRFMICTGKIK